VEAFENIREDLGNSYTVTYYPQPNPNEGFRKITVEVLRMWARSIACRFARGIARGADSRLRSQFRTGRFSPRAFWRT
jgi:hypothetical protein